MYWVDKVAHKIVSSDKYKPYWVDDMKTPSGRIHVGSLRGVVIHDLVYKALKGIGKGVSFTWVYDDSDPMDGLPIYLETEKWESYLGMPLFKVPSPDAKAGSYAEYFANEFTAVFEKIGCNPKILWTSELYLSGKMNKYIKLCLDRAEDIIKIYEQMYNKKLPLDWYPFQVACAKCGKISTTKVTDWDGEKVSYECKVAGLDWTKGCGEKGTVTPFSSKDHFAGKLPWKVEWPVKWEVIGVTIEGAGKDHMSAGGSHDIAKLIAKKILGYEVPFAIPYEFFLIGGKKMSSSKGLGTSAKEISDILPPYLLRFLFARTDYREAINFDPVETMVIPDLFDEYDRAWKAYAEGGNEDLARIFELSQIEKLPPKRKVNLPRFRDVVNYLQQPSVELKSVFPSSDEKVLEERITYAKLWLDNYAPQEFRNQMTEKLPGEAKDLSNEQKEYLSKVAKLVEEASDADELQINLYKLTKALKINTKAAFSAIYLSFIGKTHGPKAAWFLLQYPKEKVIDRLKEASK